MLSVLGGTVRQEKNCRVAGNRVLAVPMARLPF
jgi:hypothetical protein